MDGDSYAGRRLRGLLAGGLALIMAWALAGCGPGAAARLAATPAAGAAASAGTDSAGTDTGDTQTGMTRAVPLGGASTPLTVKFRIENRPRVGAPVKVLLTILPSPGPVLQHLHGSFSGTDGLAVQSDHDFDIDNAPPGVPVTREVTVVPGQSGVLSLNATLLYDIGTRSETVTFAIPLIAQDSSS